MSTFFYVNGGLVRYDILHCRLTRVVMYLIMYFFTRFGQAFGRYGFVFVFRNFFVRRLGGGIDLSSLGVTWFFGVEVGRYISMFDVIDVWYDAFVITYDRPNYFAYLAVFFYSVDGIDSVFRYVRGAVNWDYNFDDVFDVCLGLAVLS